MRVVYLDVINKEASIRDIKDDLKVFYDMIHCRCVEMPERRIGMNMTDYYNIICDEEALLTDNPILSAIDSNNNPMLFGNLIICKVNYNTGNLNGLTELEAKHVLKMIKPYLMQVENGVKCCMLLTNCEY